jgi:hypothetical protein
MKALMVDLLVSRQKVCIRTKMNRKKLLALTNTSIGIFMAFANYNMIIIALLLYLKA